MTEKEIIKRKKRLHMLKMIKAMGWSEDEIIIKD